MNPINPKNSCTDKKACDLKCVNGVWSCRQGTVKVKHFNTVNRFEETKLFCPN